MYLVTAFLSVTSGGVLAPHVEIQTARLVAARPMGKVN
jgi:hypothetical protein